MKCNYCNNEAEWVENKEVYGRRYGKSYMIWLCRNCNAYVGCHNNTKEPLGTLADTELRELRKKAKGKFIVKFLGGTWKRPHNEKNLAYSRLGGLLGLKKGECHFGMFDKETCNKVLAL